MLWCYWKSIIFSLIINNKAMQFAKDAGFKMVVHMMPDLPNMGFERDIESFKEFFEKLLPNHWHIMENVL